MSRTKKDRAILFKMKEGFIRMGIVFFIILLILTDVLGFALDHAIYYGNHFIADSGLISDISYISMSEAMEYSNMVFAALVVTFIISAVFYVIYDRIRSHT